MNGLWRAGSHAVAAAKRLKRRAKQRLGLFDPLQLLPFRSYGTPTRLVVMGRLLEEEGVIYDSDDASGSKDPTRSQLGTLGNLRASLRRLRSDEIPDARLELRFGDLRQEVTTDQEGYFRAELEPSSPLKTGWHDVELTLLSSMAGSERTRATARIWVSGEDSSLGIISDIDDTIVRTGATNRLRMMRTVLFENAHTRSPFPGVVELYRALKEGPDGRGQNPIFYLSRSGWNLYDLFDAFFAVHGLPRGPMLLRDLRVVEPRSATLEPEDKGTRIRSLLAAYPWMRFVLIGDSGQKDPEVYLSIARESPERIRAVYIRDVTGHERDQQVRAILGHIRALGIEVEAVRESADVARHAARVGLISANGVRKVEEASARAPSESRRESLEPLVSTL